jgi:hypothetical protein
MLIFTAKPVKIQAFLILKSKNIEIMAIFTVRTVKTNPNYAFFLSDRFKAKFKLKIYEFDEL